MISKLKMLVPAAVVALALSAAIASAASAATGMLTSDGPVTQIATLTGGAGANSMSAFGFSIECPKAIYTGHKYDVTPHELIPNGATTATLTPHLGVCSAAGLPITADFNGCDYVFHFTETNGSDSYAVTATVVCPAGKHIVVTIFNSAAKHTESKPFCNLTVTENASGYAGMSAVDTTNGFVDLTGTLSGLTMDQKSPTGSILCPEQTENAATFAIDLTGEGRNAEGKATSIGLSHT